MGSNKIVFFPDKLHEGSSYIFGKLKREFKCFKSSNLDEFKQIFQQTGHFALVFSDLVYGKEFLLQHSDSLRDLRYKAFILLPKVKDEEESITPKVVNLNGDVYSGDRLEEIIKSIQEYLNEKGI